MVVLTFFVVLAVAFSAVMALTRPTHEAAVLQQRLQDLRKLRPAEVNEQEDLRFEKEEHSTRFTKYVDQLAEQPFVAGLVTLLQQANTRLTLGSFVLRSILFGYAAAVGVSFTVGVPSFEAVAFFTGAALPYLWLRRKRKRRVRAFDVQLPEAMDLMTRALRAGHSVQQALEIVAEQSNDPLRSEFAQVHQEQVFGMAFREALRKSGDRVPSHDLQFLITAMVVQKETGGDLIDILERTTHVIRERVRVQAEVQTYTAQGRLTGWILSLLPVALLLLATLLTPSYTAILFHDPVGNKLLLAAGCLIVVGAVSIQRIARVEV